MVANGGQRDVIELPGHGNSPLVDRPQCGEPVTDGEESVFRGRAHVAEERVRGDGVVHGSTAHTFTVHEQWNTGGGHFSPLNSQCRVNGSPTVTNEPAPTLARS